MRCCFRCILTILIVFNCFLRIEADRCIPPTRKNRSLPHIREGVQTPPTAKRADTIVRLTIDVGAEGVPLRWPRMPVSGRRGGVLPLRWPRVQMSGRKGYVLPLCWPRVPMSGRKGYVLPLCWPRVPMSGRRGPVLPLRWLRLPMSGRRGGVLPLCWPRVPTSGRGGHDVISQRFCIFVRYESNPD